MRVAFAGTPEFALPALFALHTHHQVVGVLTQPDRPSGRGRRVTAGPAKQAAPARGLHVAQPETLKNEAARAQLASWQAEVLVVVAYGLIVPPEVLSIPPLGCLNIHASLLPRWRGAAPIERAILAGDRSTGITIMQLDARLDTGPILLQRLIEIRATHTGGTLRAELAAIGADALLEALTGLARGTLPGRPQPEEGITYARRIEKAEARIDWAQDANRIERQVRAFNPQPIAETRLEGEQLRIFSAYAMDANEQESAPKSADPGLISAVVDGKMIVDCGRGRLAITEVQRPGRRPVSVRDLAHSLPLQGRRLG
ncbi:MAG: methionyl-tRNA formyltransferase [Sinobacteraceae bacterium]|nr:methionyl-tRNA formyltransferase [Nevskiaceae bacterium]MBV9316306.1 methionyl-tRNA formyltransferase [Gammaproteobacteria bacterium]